MVKKTSTDIWGGGMANSGNTQDGVVSLEDGPWCF